MPIDPLQIEHRIVDENGHPTPLFIQQWNKLRGAVNALEALTGVSGEFDTGTHTLHITLSQGRVTAVVAEVIPP